MKLTDEVLLKYAEGLLSPEDTAEVKGLLDEDEIAEERLRLIQASGAALARERDTEQVAGGMDALAEYILSGGNERGAEPGSGGGRQDPIDMTVGDVRSRWRIAAMAASVALLLGLGAGYFLGNPRSAGLADDLSGQPVWLVRVVDYHTLYARETVTPSHISEAEIAALERRFSARMGQKVLIPMLDAEKLEFRRGQLLQFGDEPIVQLAYLPEAPGLPIALCLKASAGEDTEPSYEKLRQLGVVRWRQKGIAYVLVGDRDKKKLLSDAQSAMRQIARG